MTTSLVAPARPPVIAALGESLIAGMQDMKLEPKRQQRGFVKLFADTVGSRFDLPTTPPSGLPITMFRANKLALGRVAWQAPQILGATSLLFTWMNLLGKPPHALFEKIMTYLPLGHCKPQPSQHNFAIPGTHLDDARTVRNAYQYFMEQKDIVPGPWSMAFLLPLLRSMLQTTPDRSGTQVERAIAVKPDMVVMWGGSSEALNATEGVVNDYTMTPMEDTPWKGRVLPGYKTIMNSIVADLERHTQAEIFIMNDPDYSDTPYLRRLGDEVGPLPYRVRLAAQDVTTRVEDRLLSRKVKGPGKNGRTEFPDGSMVALSKVRTNLRILSKWYNAMFRNEALFTEDDVVDPEEMAQIQARIDEYNTFLEELARTHPRVHLVDARGLLKKAREGLPLCGDGPPRTVTNIAAGTVDARGFGGIYSYDFLHPADTGQAVMANMLLEAARPVLGDRFPSVRYAHPIDEKASYRNDPHVRKSPYTGTPC